MTTTATSVSTHLVAHGTGSPEGAITRGVGAVYVQEDASPTLAATWVKITGTGNTGWVRQTADNLTAIAALVSAANTLAYFTGSGTAAVTDFTAGARSLVALGSYTTGDLVYASGADTLAKRGIGSSGDVLTVTGGVPVWAAPASGFADPTTTKGDLIVHGASTTRLAVGTNGQVLTADSTQTAGVKWAAAAAAGYPTISQVIVRRSSNLSLTNATITAVTWNAEDTDTDSYHDLVSATDKLTAPATGTYEVWCTLVYANTVTGSVFVIARKNGTTSADRVTRASTSGDNATSAATTIGVSLHFTINLTAGDWISFDAYQNSAGALNLIGNTAGAGEASMAGMRRVA